VPTILANRKLFYSQAAGGAAVHEIAGSAVSDRGTSSFGLSEQEEGWTGQDEKSALRFLVSTDTKHLELTEEMARAAARRCRIILPA